MSGYIDAGYAAALGALAVYASTLVVRERAIGRRLRRSGDPAPVPKGNPPSPGTRPAQRQLSGEVPTEAGP